MKPVFVVPCPAQALSAIMLVIRTGYRNPGFIRRGEAGLRARERVRERMA
ncbi:hypothetical protein AA0311_0385 [Asaia bogorensis NBRC 16594]|nr:hypothetical protein AA0311_0385 [Asaia bogorensis NBRC 16594]